jgi:hypothetical protein
VAAWPLPPPQTETETEPEEAWTFGTGRTYLYDKDAFCALRAQGGEPRAGFARCRLPPSGEPSCAHIGEYNSVG